MPYLERMPTRRSVLLLIVAFVLLYLPNLGTCELRPSEAMFGTVAREMLRSGAYWSTRVHGDPVEAYPAYAWLVAVGDAAGLPDEWSVRLPAGLCVGALAILAGWMAHRRGGGIAAFAAAAMVLANIACLRVGRRAQSETLLAFLLMAAWWSWYDVGQRRKRWTLAWSLALALLLPAVFAAGSRAIVIFYLPFLFLRRPVRGRRRLLLPSHLVPMAFFLAAVGYWLHRVPAQTFFPWNELQTMPQVTLSYPLDILMFPLKCGVYLFPWTFMLWPSFCLAYRPLEKDRLVFHYLRTIVLSVFLAGWAMPQISPLALLPALGPLAVMTGLHFEILVRRHILRLRRLGWALGAASLILGLAAGLALLLHLGGLVRLEGLTATAALRGLLLPAVAAALGAMVLRGPLRSSPFRLQLLAGFAGAAAACIGAGTLWLAWSGGEQRDAGHALAGRIQLPAVLAAETSVAPPADGGPAPPAGTTIPPRPVGVNGLSPDATPPVPAERAYRPLAASSVYRTTRGYHVAACFYLGRPIIRVRDAKTDIPIPAAAMPAPSPDRAAEPQRSGGSPEATGTEPVLWVDAVYVLGSVPPIIPEIDWTPLTPPIDPRRRKSVQSKWFPGGMRLLHLAIVAAPMPPDHQPESIRLFRGTRR